MSPWRQASGSGGREGPVVEASGPRTVSPARGQLQAQTVRPSGGGRGHSQLETSPLTEDSHPSLMPQDTPSPSANSVTRSGWRAPTPPVSSLCLPGAELLSKECVPSGPGAEKNSQDLWARGSVSLTLWFHFSFNWRDRISRASELLECLTPAPSA